MTLMQATMLSCSATFCMCCQRVGRWSQSNCGSALTALISKPVPDFECGGQLAKTLDGLFVGA